MARRNTLAAKPVSSAPHALLSQRRFEPWGVSATSYVHMSLRLGRPGVVGPCIGDLCSTSDMSGPIASTGHRSTSSATKLHAIKQRACTICRPVSLICDPDDPPHVGDGGDLHASRV